MAKVTAQERENAREAVVLDQELSNIMPLTADPDSEQSWDDWQEGLKTSEAAGTVRVYKLPVDGDGNPQMNKGSRQTLLGSWSHQLYSFDQLVQKITLEFLAPGEVAHIRIQGNQMGQRGNMFNRVITLQRARGEVAITNAPHSEVSGALRVMQEGQAQMNATLERLLTKAPEEKKDWLETTGKLMAILTPILTPVVTHLLTRQPPKSDLEALMGTMLKMKDFMSGEGGGGEDNDSMTSMIKAIAPGALQVMATLAARQPAPVAQVQRRVAVRSVPPTAPVPAPTPEVAPEIKPQEVNPMLAQLIPQLNALADLAAQGADPVEVAKLTLETLPDNEELDELIFSYVSDASRFNMLLTLSPKLKAQAAWAESLRVALLAEFQSPDELTLVNPTVTTSLPSV